MWRRCTRAACGGCLIQEETPDGVPVLLCLLCGEEIPLAARRADSRVPRWARRVPRETPAELASAS